MQLKATKLAAILSRLHLAPLALFAALGLALAAPQTAQAGNYYKFTFLRVKENPTGSGNGPVNGQLAISELALYDANMMRINRALTRNTTSVGSLAQGEAYFSSASALNSTTTSDGKSTIAPFDDIALNDKKWMVSETISTLHPYVVMRLADDASPAAFYNLASADAVVDYQGKLNYDNRLPAEWTVEYSTDGSNWSELDHRNLADSRLPTTDRTWYAGAGAQVNNTAPKTCFLLQSQYTQVEYIDSETFQPGKGPALRIFGFHLQADDYIETAVVFNDIDSTGGGAKNHAIFCNRQGTDSVNSFVSFVIGDKLRFDYGPAGSSVNLSSATLSKDRKYVIQGDGASDKKLTATATGVTTVTANATSGQIGDTLTTDLLLFAHSAYSGSGAGTGWDAPQTASDSSMARMKMYYFKVYDAKGSSSLRLDLIPVTVGSQVGMYDQVSGVFYKSVTGTEFTAGDPVAPTPSITVNLNKTSATYGESGWDCPSIVSLTIGDTDVPYDNVKASFTEAWYPASITQAGSYTLTVTGKAGTTYDGQTAIATYTVDKASIDVSEVAFDDGSFPYDGNAHSLEVANLPAVASVAYSGNSRTDVGSQTVTATLSATDATNYELTGTPVRTATLTITQAQNIFTSGPSISGWVEGQTPSNPSATPKFGNAADVTFQYSSNDTSGYTDTKPSTAGTWYMKATSP